MPWYFNNYFTPWKHYVAEENARAIFSNKAAQIHDNILQRLLSSNIDER